MKSRVVFIAGLFLLFIPYASAAPAISVKQQQVSFTYSSTQEIVKGLLTNNSIITVGQREGRGEITSRSLSGEEQWSFLPSNSVIVTDIKASSDGTLWVVGASETFETRSVLSSAGAINPDSVTVTTPAPVSRGLTQLQFWQISPSGTLLTSFLYTSAVPIYPRALLVTSTGLVAVGSQQSATGQTGALWFCSFTSCEKAISLGKSSTVLRDITMVGGDFYVVGESAETLFKLPLKGVVDGITLRIDKNGAMKSAVRSSLPSARRSWESVTPSFLHGGFALTKSGEATITQFSTKKFGVPVWSARFPASSSAFTAGNGAAFVSTGAISQLKNWKPKSQLILLNFDSKGAVKRGTNIINGGVPLWMSYLKGLGYGVISVQSNTMCFTLIAD